MLFKNCIKLLFCLGLSLPATALQPDHDELLLPYQQSFGYQSPPLLYKPQPQFSARFDESHLSVFFSFFSVALIVLAIRGQQRQDYSQFRDPRKHHRLALPNHQFQVQKSPAG